MVNIQKQIQDKLTRHLLDLIILQLLDERPMCGYEIMSTIKRTHGVLLGASTMYPALNALEDKEMVKSEWNTQSRRPKRIYKITKDGHAAMEYSVGSLHQICKTLQIASKNNRHIEIGAIMP